MLDLKAMSYALLVDEYGSFRKAALSLNVPPSVVSRRVRALEDALGVSLFQRRTQGAESTLAGRRILSRARAITADLEELLRFALSSSSGSEGILRVGTVSSIAGGTARELLRVFLADRENIDLQIFEGSPRDHISEVRALEMDVAFIVGTPSALECVVEPLWSEPILLALGSEHLLAANDEISWSDLVSEHFIVSKTDPGPEIHDHVVKRLLALGSHPNIEARPVTRDGLMALVGLGRGVSLVGGAEAGVTYPGVAFRPLAGEKLPFSAVWSERNDNPVLRRFLSLSRAHLKTLDRQTALIDAGSSTVSGVRPQNPGLSP